MAMIEHKDFRIGEVLYESSRTRVLRAWRLRDRLPVILKTPMADYPTPDVSSRYRREFEILRRLRGAPGIIQVHELAVSQHALLLVEEDGAGQPLSQLIVDQPQDWPLLLDVAVQLAAALAEMHRCGVVHKDINPANVLWNPQRRELKVIDFSIASLLSVEYQDFQNPNQLEGTYAYLSPEQTGRVNRPLDYRSDFYSLGVTLYHLFTGRLPFVARLGIEYVHAHIAQQPPPPDRVNPAVPPMVAAILMKLLNKMADDRYQSATGVQWDLQRCLDALQTGGAITGFPLAQRDHSAMLRIPQRLYGREQDVASILAAFDRVSRGQPELLLVAGYSGTGKSALVHEVYRPLTERHGLYVAGKFDQYQRDLPFYAWRQAIEAFCRLLLREDEQGLATWRQRIGAGLGNIGRVITDLAPSLEWVIGEQPEVPVLSGEQALNRFNYAFRKFIDAVASPEHPLVMFIDDWQWADAASIGLLKSLVAEVGERSLLIIAAWRDNEVDRTHPFGAALLEIEQSPTKISEVRLDNLQRQHVAELLADTLGHPQALADLVDLVYQKTGGNAFFLIQFLKNLYQDALLRFDSQRQCWSWNMDEIRQRNITDNVVELMAAAIGRLEPATRSALQQAACIGNRFELTILAIILGRTPQETAETLEPALRQGILNPIGGSYRFASYQGEVADVAYQFIHDRVQQAAYGLIDANQRKRAHHDIARTLLDTLDEEARDRRVFEIVNHVNLADELFCDAAEQQLLLDLNLAAGRRAKNTTAYTPALQYLRMAIRHLAPDAWQRHRTTTAQLFLLAAETAYLTNSYDDMERWLDEVLRHVDTPMLQAEVYQVRLQAYISQNRLNDAVQASLHALALLGVRLPARPNPLQLLLNLARTRALLKGRSHEDLLALPPMTDPVKLKIMSLLGLTIPPAYWTSQELLALIVFQMIRESLASGYSPNTGYGFSWWGITQGALLGNLEDGYAYGEFGVTIARTHQLNLQRPLFFQGWITRQFRRTIKESIPILMEAYSLALEKGDFEYASYALNNYVQARLHSGEPLSELLDQMTRSHQDLLNFKVGSSLYWHDIWWQAALNFRESSDRPERLQGLAYREDEALPQHRKVKDASTLFLLFTAKLMLAVFFGQSAKAVAHAREARQHLKSGAGMYALVLFHLYESLALLHTQAARSPWRRQLTLHQVRANLRKLRQWADHSPANHRHRWHLLMAEYLRARGRDAAAAVHYDQAIEAAWNNGFVHDEALCCECAGVFYHARKQASLRDFYLGRARTCYQSWGAEAKLAQLLGQWGPLQRRGPGSDHGTGHVTVLDTASSSSAEGNELDLATLMKSYHAISGKIVLSQLVRTLLAIVIENAGAQSGALLLIKDGALCIEAQARADDPEIRVLQSIPLAEAAADLPLSLVYYVERSQQSLVLDDAQATDFSDDPYLRLRQTLSILCEPILYQGKLTGVLYLENSLTRGAFTKRHQELLRMLVAQAAISIENSMLYEELEDKVAERTRELEASLAAQKDLNDALRNNSRKLDQAYEELREANQLLQHQANTDALTGLSNRRYFNRFFEHEYHRGIRRGQPLSLLLCDIDNFKAFNDQYGHLAGDDCLKTVADVFRHVFCRATDLVARFGGEEIVVVLPDIAERDARKLAEHLRSEVQGLAIAHQGNAGFGVVTISIGGISLIPETDDSIESITQRADEALYQAKSEGRNQVRFFTTDANG